MVFPRKTLQHSLCEPRLSVDLWIEKNEGDLACFKGQENQIACFFFFLGKLDLLS